MKIGIVVAVDNHNGIGLSGSMPWSCAADLRHFSAVTRTMGGNILMGRKTWQSIGSRPLPGRTAYVWSSSDPGGDAVWVRNPDELALDFVWAVGGTSVYDWAAARDPAIAFITHLDGTFGCDTMFGGLRGQYSSELVGVFEQDARNSCSGRILKYLPLK